jgi:choline dehydrogenase-like flavoprotein
VHQKGPFYERPLIRMRDSTGADGHLVEINDFKNKVIESLGGRPLKGDNLDLKRAGIGSVAHEVGTLRMALQRNGVRRDGVVDANLRFLNYENLYACDLSVFPSSPAANPSLTLVALALRLAEHLKQKYS